MEQSTDINQLPSEVNGGPPPQQIPQQPPIQQQMPEPMNAQHPPQQQQMPPPQQQMSQQPIQPQMPPQQPQMQQQPQPQQAPPIREMPEPMQTQHHEQIQAPPYNPNIGNQEQGQGQGQGQGQIPQPQGGFPPNNPNNVPPTEPLSQEDIERLHQDMKRAGETGITKLPSRDIPQQSTQITMDEQQNPNYIPGHGSNAPSGKYNRDYIEQYDNMESIMAERQQRASRDDRLNQLYEEVQTPVLIIVLFFIFQLPFVNKIFQKYMPKLFIEGKATLGAYILQALLFGGAYYGIRQIMNVFT